MLKNYSTLSISLFFTILLIHLAFSSRYFPEHVNISYCFSNTSIGSYSKGVRNE